MASKGTILVVDDDRLVLAMVTHGLVQAGYEVIALLDIRMQGKSGFDVAQYLREVGHTPFVFLSAFSDEKTVAQVKALGALAYLVKPLEVGQIVPTIDAACARAQEMRRAAAEAARSAEVPAPQEAPLDEPAVLAAIVPLAMGVLMHRFSLTRSQALTRLQKTAVAEGRTVEALAQRLVLAVEALSGTPDVPA